MFAYLIVGIEIAILYSVYWYVFVREPQPFKVASNMWGTYDYRGDDLSTYADWSFTTSRYITDSERQEIVKLQKGLLAASATTPMKPVENTSSYGWVLNERKTDGTAVNHLLSKFRDTIEVLTVKVP